MWSHRWQPTRLPHPWGSPGKNTGVGCHFLLQCMKLKSESEVTQSCPNFSNAMDCSLPGASVPGIFQARVLEWGAIAFSVVRLGLVYFWLHLLCKYSPSRIAAGSLGYLFTKAHLPWWAPYSFWQSSLHVNQKKTLVNTSASQSPTDTNWLWTSSPLSSYPLQDLLFQ